jgi:desulfoferrodoxin (superoxide reductase-like protein)
MKSKFKITSSIALIFFLFLSLGSFANKTSVKIVAPEKVAAGTEVTIKIEVTHIGNTKAHYSDWVVLKINGEEYKKWEYTKDNLPDTQNFTLEFTIKAETDLEIIAEGNCNKHGSKGEDKVNIKVEQ